MVKVILITLAVVCTVSILPAHGFNLRTISKFNLEDDLLRAASPQATTQCFTVYSPQLSAVTKEYEAEYANCSKAAENSKEIINNEVAPSYATALQYGKDVCNSFSQCTQGPSDSYGFFQCNNDGATDAITISYNIQNLSKDRMEYINMRSQMVTYDLNACTAKCSQKYIEDYADVYSKLQDCLAGKAPAETTTGEPATVEPVTTSTRDSRLRF